MLVSRLGQVDNTSLVVGGSVRRRDIIILLEEASHSLDMAAMALIQGNFGGLEASTTSHGTAVRTYITYLVRKVLVGRCV